MDKKNEELRYQTVLDPIRERDQLQAELASLREQKALATYRETAPSPVAAEVVQVPSVEALAEALNRVKCFHDMSAELIAPTLRENLIAAARAADHKEQGLNMVQAEPAADVRQLPRELLERLATHLSNWLELNDCECEGPGHYCGRTQVSTDRDELRALLAASQGEAK